MSSALAWRVPVLPTTDERAVLHWAVTESVGLLDMPGTDTAPGQRQRRYVSLADVGSQLWQAFQVNACPNAWVWYDTMLANRTAIGIRGNTQAIVHTLPAGRTQTYRGQRYRVSDGSLVAFERQLILPEMAYIQLWKMDQPGRPPYQTGCYVSAVVGQPMTGVDARIRSWPWGNVYDRGAICWGTSVCATTPPTFHAIDAAFFEGRFNMDLFRGTPDDRRSLQGEGQPDVVTLPAAGLPPTMITWTCMTAVAALFAGEGH